MSNYDNDFERLFRTAYQKLNGKPVSQFKCLESGDFIINGIRFSAPEAQTTLDIIEQELQARAYKSSLVKRLIRFFGGKDE